MIAADIPDRVVELRRVRANEIIPHEKNAREHPESQRNALRAVMSQLGFAGAILAVERDGKLKCCDGHLRTEEMGDREVPVLVLDLNDDEVETLLLSFDAIGSMAKFNRERLEALLGTYDRTKATIDPALMNGLQADLDKMLKSLAKGAGSDWGKTQEALQDEVPELPTVPVTDPGDLWVCGNHRVLCGDATRADDYQRLMNDGPATMIVTDPPWNVAIGMDSNPRHRQREGLVNDDLTPEAFAAFLRNFAVAAKQHVTGDVYCVLGASEWPTLDLALRGSGYHWSATVIWVKDMFVLGRSKYHRRYEPLWYGWKADGRSSFQGQRDLDDVWEIPRPKRSEEHPTMKPVELIARAIRNSSETNQIVLDPFSGSGTAVIACEQLGRRCRTMELSPIYVDVTASRWAAISGREPILESTGETFTQVKERRTAERAQATPNVASTDPPEEPQPAPASTSPAKQPQKHNGKKKRSK